MRIFAFALAVVLYWFCFACAFAERGVEPPPASYLTKTPAVPVFIHHVKDPDAVCQAIFPSRGWHYEGCTVLLTDEKRCDVYEPIADPDDDYGVKRVAAIEQHEVQGHCNGLVHVGNTGRGWQTKDGKRVEE